MPQVKGDSTTDDGVVGTSSIPGKSGVFGFNSAGGGNGVAGISEDGNGIYGSSETLNGIYGQSRTGSGVHGHSIDQVAVYGDSEKGDAIVGKAKSVAKSGVFGINESTGDAASPGGSGVFGLTKASKAAGVFGANNNLITGRGVQGNGAEAGVGGFSEMGVGIVGHSNKGDGAQGFTVASNRNGILGRNSSTARSPQEGAPSGNGVFGYTDVPNASGVCGAVGANNSEGAGVTGIGTTAGRFFGNVQITGKLTIQSIPDLVMLLQQLQDKIASLEHRLSVVEQKGAQTPSGSGTGTSNTQTTPRISVTSEGSGQSSTFKIPGTGFNPNSAVTVRVADDQLASQTFQSTSDSTGKFELRQRVSCISGLTLYFSATDGRPNSQDLTGLLWSNTVTLSCP